MTSPKTVTNYSKVKDGKLSQTLIKKIVNLIVLACIHTSHFISHSCIIFFTDYSEMITANKQLQQVTDFDQLVTGSE